MSGSNCSAFLEQFDQWMEGERSPAAESHIRTCAECSNLLADLNSIRDAAPTLTAGDPEPPERVWAALRAQLEDEGLIHEVRQGAVYTVKRWLLGTSWVPRPVLAGSYLVVLIAAGFALSGSSGPRNDSDLWMSRTQHSTLPLSASLDTAEESAISSMVSTNPVVTASLRKSLAVIDNNIALCEKSVREEPQDEFARDYLYEAYQQKADLIAQVTEGDEGQ